MVVVGGMAMMLTVDMVVMVVVIRIVEVIITGKKCSSSFDETLRELKQQSFFSSKRR